MLANDEVVDGVSVRGGYPVVQRKMRQWCLRVSAYAQRMLDGLDLVDWSDSIKETQRNWVGRSEGAEMHFESITPEGTEERRGHFTIFTTRADTIFGVTFMVLAPESELVAQLTTSEQREEVEAYLAYVAKRTERDRMADHKVTGVFSGSYGVNPFTGERIPIWISEYVLAGYGTGAIMAVPAHDSRDYAFARHFQLPIVPLIEGADVSQESFDAKEGTVMNSPREGVNSTLTLNGLTVQEAIAKTKAFIAEQGIGHTHLHEHGAEVVALLEVGADFFHGHFALAQVKHALSHLVHLVVVGGVDDLETLDVEVAGLGRRLHVIDIADKDRRQEAALLQAGSGLKDAGVGALGVNDLARIGFENFNQIFEHGVFLQYIHLFSVCCEHGFTNK